MIYIDALNLINLALESNILKEKEGKVLVCVGGGENEEDKWVMKDKDLLAKILMDDKEGQNVLIKALKAKNVIFKEMDFGFRDKKQVLDVETSKYLN